MAAETENLADEVGEEEEAGDVINVADSAPETKTTFADLVTTS